MTKNIAVIITAGGTGERLGGSVPKQYLPIAKKAMIAHSAELFSNREDIIKIVVTIHSDHKKLAEDTLKNIDKIQIVTGGESRQASVHQGLLTLEEDAPDLVLIHDAARPFIDNDTVDRIIAKLKTKQAVIPILAITDTIKKITDQKIQATIDRMALYRAQTPQGFSYQTILNLHNNYQSHELTDDASLCEEAGINVFHVKGSEENQKITTMDDYIHAQSQIITGIGFDVHRFDDVAGNDHHVTLCGIDIPHIKPLKGHSDADAGLHAIVDAMLGTIAAGDIGDHFPPTDSKWQDADSSLFVLHAKKLLEEQEKHVHHIDLTLICELPKITPHKLTMRKKLSSLLDLPIERVSIKATTTEGCGYVGKGEGIGAQAVVSVY